MIVTIIAVQIWKYLFTLLLRWVIIMIVIRMMMIDLMNQF